jgi:hypothetical protein
MKTSFRYGVVTNGLVHLRLGDDCELDAEGARELAMFLADAAEALETAAEA